MSAQLVAFQGELGAYSHEALPNPPAQSSVDTRRTASTSWLGDGAEYAICQIQRYRVNPAECARLGEVHIEAERLKPFQLGL